MLSHSTRWSEPPKSWVNVSRPQSRVTTLVNRHTRRTSLLRRWSGTNEAGRGCEDRADATQPRHLARVPDGRPYRSTGGACRGGREVLRRHPHRCLSIALASAHRHGHSVGRLMVDARGLSPRAFIQPASSRASVARRAILAGYSPTKRRTFLSRELGHDENPVGGNGAPRMRAATAGSGTEG